jgi:hypothetical protein
MDDIIIAELIDIYYIVDNNFYKMRIYNDMGAIEILAEIYYALDILVRDIDNPSINELYTQIIALYAINDMI